MRMPSTQTEKSIMVNIMSQMLEFIVYIKDYLGKSKTSASQPHRTDKPVIKNDDNNCTDYIIK